MMVQFKSGVQLQRTERTGERGVEGRMTMLIVMISVDLVSVGQMID